MKSIFFLLWTTTTTIMIMMMASNYHHHHHHRVRFFFHSELSNNLICINWCFFVCFLFHLFTFIHIDCIEFNASLSTTYTFDNKKKSTIFQYANHWYWIRITSYIYISWNGIHSRYCLSKSIGKLFFFLVAKILFFFKF